MEAPQQIEESYRYAIQVTRRSRSQFFLSFLVLPKEQFRAISVLYAFLRMTDDIADLSSLEAQTPLQKIQSWRNQWELALTGQTDSHPIFPALMQVVDRYHIDPQWLSDVISGVETDIHSPHIMTLQDLEQYCYQVAGTVGLCCMKIWGCDEQTAYEQQAVRCGFAFQMTNILRDITEDVKRGRCYLPEEELAQFGYTREQWDQSIASEAFLELIQFQAERIEQAYRESSSLETRLTGPSRKMFRIMFQTYYRLFLKVRKLRLQSDRRTTRLHRWEKLQLLAQEYCCPPALPQPN